MADCAGGKDQRSDGMTQPALAAGLEIRPRPPSTQPPLRIIGRRPCSARRRWRVQRAMMQDDGILPLAAEATVPTGQRRAILLEDVVLHQP